MVDRDEPGMKFMDLPMSKQLLDTMHQPIQALEHPKFRKMMDVAARATRGLKHLSRKETRQRIIQLFKTQMKALSDRLNVCIIINESLYQAKVFDPQSKVVSSEISLTCDAWQASSNDGYFAATGHWIEEPSPGKWNEEEALFGFTQMNTSHNGTWLGQAL